MSNIGAFIHLYHVWGLFGLLTALLYGRSNYLNWRAQGGLFRTAPFEWLQLIRHHSILLIRDVGLIFKVALARFVGADVLWPNDPKSPWKYEREQSLLFGIMLGGLSRFATAFYWAEKNQGWMTEQSVLIPAITVVYAVVADISHQASAWVDYKHRVRLLVFAAVVWVALGGILGT